MPLSQRQFARRFLALFGVILAALAVASVTVDPFWIWQEAPYWVAKNDGRNTNLFMRMRFVKSLQVLTRPTDTVFIGPSPLFYAFDMVHVKNGERAYNFGIDDMRIHELEGFTHHLLRWKKVDTLVVDVEYPTFDERWRTQPGFDPMIARPGYAPEALLSTMFSRDGVEALDMRKEGGRTFLGAVGVSKEAALAMPALEFLTADWIYNKYHWHYNGFSAMTPASAERVNNLLLMQNKLLDGAVIDDESFAALERTLADANRHGVRKLILCLSPMHEFYLNRIRENGQQADFDAWRARVERIALSHGAAFHDLTVAPFSNDPGLFEKGSTEYWTDAAHFTPKGSEWFLKEIGLYE